jgi:hypothetical protein
MAAHRVSVSGSSRHRGVGVKRNGAPPDGSLPAVMAANTDVRRIVPVFVTARSLARH